jgi:Pectate lyase superfamily protein
MIKGDEMTDYRIADIATATAPTIIESYPFGGLPAPGSAGRLARVTDRKARLWLDDGARWSPLVDNTVNALSFGRVDPNDAKVTTPTLKDALKTGVNVYLPPGTYPVNEPLEFHSGQTIFGDGKGTTVITAADPITIFRPAIAPKITRDVLIRDLTINNSVPWQPAGVGVDFTGVSLSRIERLSMRGHGTAVLGRDSALRTYVRDGSTDTWLHVTATDGLLYAAGDAIGIRYRNPQKAAITLKGTVTDVAAPNNPDHPALAVTLTGGASPLPALSAIPEGAEVYHDDPHAGGYYNTVADCEIAGCLRAISLVNAGNAWTVLDGRIFKNIRGIYVESSSGNRFRSTFEANGVGVEFGSGSSENTVLAGSYFEGNGDPGRWELDPVKPVVLGAVRCHSGAVRNTIEPCHFSGGHDYVVDEADEQNNTCSSPHLPAFPALPSGVGNGGNIISNGDFAVWTQASGLPDGWRSTRPVPGTMRFEPETDPAKAPAGTTTALRWSMSKGRNDYFAIYRELAVVPGQWYTFTARTMVDEGDRLYTLFIVSSLSFTQEQELYYSGALPTHDYATGLHRATFKVPDGVSSVYLLLRNVNNSAERTDPSCWVGEQGATARFGKFQLEPGRGVSTESRDSGLMGHVQTTGGPLTIDDKAEITVTHPFHTVAPGTNGVLKRINPPPGFSGMIVLHATGTWTATTDGTGPGKIGTPLSMIAGKTTIGWYDTGAGTWWFPSA